MDWSREPWRKLYTRETSSWAALDHEAQAALMMFLKTCEPDGTIAGDARKVARFWRWPADFVQTGLEQLVGVGTIERTDHGWRMVNFEEAQAARTGSTERSRRKRENDRARTRKAAHKEGTRGDAEGREGTPGDARGRIEKNRREEKEEKPTATATTGNSVNSRPARYAGGWEKGRAVLQELTDDLDRRVRWPLTPPEGWWEGVTASGGVDELSEALRRVRDGIKNGTIEPDRWHGRMFYGRAWPALMLKLDEMDTQQAARDRARKADEERWKKSEQNERPTLSGEEYKAISQAFGLGDT